MKLYNQLLKYIGENYRGFIFLSLFYSLIFLNKFIATFNPELTSFSGRMIGEATLQGYDISKRITAFYSAGLIFILGNIFFSIFAWRISSSFKFFFKTPELQIINYTSLAGIVLYFFSLWGSPINSSLELLYDIHKVVLTGLLIKLIFFKKNKKLITIPLYAIFLVLAISGFFMWNEFSVLLNFLPKTNLLYILLLSSIILLILISQLIKNKNAVDSRTAINKLAFLLVPIALIPLLSVLKDETYLILNRHQIYYFSPLKLYIIGGFCIMTCIAWRYYIIKKNPAIRLIKNTSQLVAFRYFPFFILGISAFTFYNPFLQSSTEMFEAGNQLLPLMEFQKFGVVPIIEKFNSHELSELFFGGIYSFFNGLHGREIFIYDFFYQVLWAFLVYYFICKLTRNAYIALFLILLLPIIEPLLPDYHAIALIAIFILHKIIEEKASLKKYLLFFACITLLLLWRIDIGYPALIAIVGTLFIYWINQKRFIFNKQLLLKTVLVFFTSFFLLLVAIAWWRNFNVFHNLNNILNYLSSAQSYGHVDLSYETSPSFKMQYYVFPLIILIGFGSLLVFFRQYTISSSQRFIYTSIVFLAIYYFVNFQRGLVRHSFAEGHDEALSSFLFFILSSSVYLFFHRRTQLFKFIAFILLSIFLLMNYKFPAVANPQNMYSKFITKVEQFPVIIPKENIVRCTNDMDFENSNYRNFKKFISQKLNDKQTFIDFSNNPMLYYYTEKISPSYFYQNPLTIHNDFLQKNFISDLQKYDAPLIVFSNFPETAWDNIDGVPNELRHYRIAEYFYSHYEPFTIIDNLCIWKRKDFKIMNEQKLVYNYSEQIKDSTKNNSFINGIIKKSGNKNYLFKIILNNFNDSNVQEPLITIVLASGKQNVKPNFVDKINHIGYYMFSTSESVFSFDINNGNKNISALQIYECDYVPDFYSSTSKQIDVKQLPYIWGTFDNTIHKEIVLADLIPTPEKLQKNNIHYFKINTSIDKSSGNTILFSMKSNNDTPIQMELMYGVINQKLNKGSFIFTIPKGNGIREFAVRISTQYNWYSTSIDYIALNSKDIEGITIDKLQLLKGN